MRIWSAESDTPIQLIAGFNGEISCLQFSPDGLSLAVSSKGDGVRCYKTDRGRNRYLLSWRSIRSQQLDSCNIDGTRLSRPNARYLRQEGAGGDPNIVEGQEDSDSSEDEYIYPKK